MELFKIKNVKQDTYDNIFFCILKGKTFLVINLKIISEFFFYYMEIRLRKFEKNWLKTGELDPFLIKKF